MSLDPGKGVVSSPTPWCSSYWKELLGRIQLQLPTLLNICISPLYALSMSIWYREKARRKLYKNSMSYTEQILEAPSHKTAVKWVPTSHL